ncbi:FeoA family protein [Niallia sp. JL1B1071]|uniref:FeoA family protein n=1 Tax=Niallia tiangongensis TaxID=3237105 RepID=UPI0037DCEDA3
MEVSVGQRLKINKVEEGNSMLQRRLLDFGLMEGAVITIQQILPFEGPCILEYEGTLIGMRKRDMKILQMERV